MKGKIVLGLLALPVLYFGAALATAIQKAHGLAVFGEVASVLQNPLLLTWTQDTPKIMLLALTAYFLCIGLYVTSKRKTRAGKEHGSAVWGNAAALRRKYAEKDYAQNLLVTQNFRLGLNPYKHRRNLNVLVVGGSGSGKSRFYARPNIMQCNASFIITDAKGELLRDTGHLLQQQGYEIRVFDLVNPRASNSYNPFAYVRGDKDVLKLITNLIQNTTPKGAKQSEPFWESAEKTLLQALMLYLLYEAPPEEQNFPTLLDLLRAEEVREEDASFMSVLDMLFDDLKEREPDHIACKLYSTYKSAAGKTAKSILVSVGVRLSAFNLTEIANITCTDELEIDQIAERKTALFLVIPDNDSSFNFLAGMLYSQAFQQLYYLADKKYNGSLPIPVHCVMDEFASVALPDEFDKLLATMRSRRISVSIIIQNLAQLKFLFKDNWESLVGNADSFLFLGGNEKNTFKYISELLGRETIDTTTRGMSRGRMGSSNVNYQNAGRELLTQDEVRLLDNAECIYMLRGERPITDKKFDLMKHPNIKQTPDGGAPRFVFAPPNKDPLPENMISISDDDFPDEKEIPHDDKGEITL